MQLNGILIKDLNVVLVTTSFQRVWLGDEKLPTNTKVTIPVDRLSDLHFKSNRIQLLGYTNGVEQISPEEFSSRQAKILNGNDYEDLDLDGRYAYDKFFETYKQVFGQEVEERTPVEVNIVQVQFDTGSEFITECWSVQEVPNVNRLYKLNEHDAGISFFTTLVRELKLNVDLPNHSGLRFAKVDGSYVFGDEWELNKIFYGTLEMCKNRLEALTKDIKQIVQVQLAKKNGVSLAEGDWPELMVELEALRNSFRNVSSMKSTQSEYSACTTRIVKAINLVKSKVIARVEDK